MATAVSFFSWADVDPRERAFDPAPARAAAEAIIARALRKGDDALEDDIDRALIAHYGGWAAGWRWAASEPGGGGPVRGWCCARDSLLVADERHRQATVERVTAALAEWWGFLCELEQSFAALRAAHAALPAEEGVARAAARLLPLVVERTGANDAWYATFAQVIGWYLESAGYPPERAQRAFWDVADGRFGSWIEPDEATAAAVCADLARQLGQAPADDRDALGAWLATRALAFESRPARAYGPLAVDGHRRFIAGAERRRDPTRAERMDVALDVCRAAAERGEALSWELLCRWQALVLGAERVVMRRGDAFAKQGRERYPLLPDLEQRFAAALAEASSGEGTAVRAARAYLDVCFFHPFEDGNGRAARLLLDYLLHRDGFALCSVEPLIVVARSASDRRGAWYFAWLVDYLMGRSCR